jgi:hypothetical protein
VEHRPKGVRNNKTTKIMIVIQLHDKDEDVVGSVFLEDSSDFTKVCEYWDKFLAETDDTNVYEFESMFGGVDLFSVIQVDFYQP